MAKQMAKEIVAPAKVTYRVPALVVFDDLPSVKGISFPVHLDQAEMPNDELGSYLVRYALRVILTRACAGETGGKVCEAAIRGRIKNLLSGEVSHGGPRLEPDFRLARDKVAAALKVKPTTIKTWDDIASKVKPEMLVTLRAWAKQAAAGPDISDALLATE